MLADHTKGVPRTKVKGTRPDALILQVLDFVEIRLVEFSERFSHVSPETGLTSELVNLLQRDTYKDVCPFWFRDGYLETPERGDSREPDIGVMPKETIVIKGKSFPYDSKLFVLHRK